MTLPLISMRQITKRFPGVIANNKINLELYPGEIHALLGENGSGKSTLMSILTGLYKPTEGCIMVGGEEVKFASPADAIASGIGMVHQHFKLVDVLTAAENIVLGLPGKGRLDMKKITADIQKLVDKYGFELNLSQKIYEMSVSQKQTVEIIKMLYRGARILILDEPTRGIDIGTKTEIQKLVLDLADQGMAVTFISSEVEEMLRTCSRMGVLRDGKKVGEISGDQLTQEGVMKAIAGGDSNE